jgi:hypothetical protein
MITNDDLFRAHDVDTDPAVLADMAPRLGAEVERLRGLVKEMRQTAQEICVSADFHVARGLARALLAKLEE